MTIRAVLAFALSALFIDPCLSPASQVRQPSASSKSEEFLNNAPVVTITSLDVQAADAIITDRANKSVTINAAAFAKKVESLPGPPNAFDNLLTFAKTQARETNPDKPKTVVIPAGSIITVRLVKPLDSDSKLGDTFTAVVTGLIAAGGEVAVPLGAPVIGQVTGVKAKKKATEKARLKVALTSIAIDGTSYQIKTKLIETKVKGQGNKAMSTNTPEGAGASVGSDLVFKLTVPVTVNRQRIRESKQMCSELVVAHALPLNVCIGKSKTRIRG